MKNDYVSNKVVNFHFFYYFICGFFINIMYMNKKIYKNKYLKYIYKYNSLKSKILYKKYKQRGGGESVSDTHDEEEIFIDTYEEIDYIVKNSKLPYDIVHKVIMAYDKYIDEDPNPENHFEKINRDTSVSLKIIENIFCWELKYLYLNGLASRYDECDIIDENKYD